MPLFVQCAMVYFFGASAAQRWRRGVTFFEWRGAAPARWLAVAVLAREGSSRLRSAERLRTAQVVSRHDFRSCRRLPVPFRLDLATSAGVLARRAAAASELTLSVGGRRDAFTFLHRRPPASLRRVTTIPGSSGTSRPSNSPRTRESAGRSKASHS